MLPPIGLDGTDGGQSRCVEDKDKEKCSGTPKLCLLPTTSPAFRENALRAYYLLAVWCDVLHQSRPSLTSTEHGWSGVEGHSNITPTIERLSTPLAPMELLKIIKCECNSNMSRENTLQRPLELSAFSISLYV